MKMYTNTIKTRDPSHPRQCSRQGLFKDGEKTMGVGIHYFVYVLCILFSCFVFCFEAENLFCHPKFVVVQPQPYIHSSIRICTRRSVCAASFRGTFQPKPSLISTNQPSPHRNTHPDSPRMPGRPEEGGPSEPRPNIHKTSQDHTNPNMNPTLHSKSTPNRQQHT